jgi:cell division protein FtsA
MKLAKKTNLIAGLDIGSSKICTIIGEVHPEGLVLLAVGQSATEGFKRGVVTCVSELVESIRQSVHRAEQEAGTHLDSVFVTVPGSSVTGINATGSVTIKNKAREVMQEDIYEAIEAAKEVQIPEGMVVIHVLPQEFILDGQIGISDPLGMMGEQLQVRIHMMLNSSVTVQNIINVVNKSGLIVAGTLMPQVASAAAVLTSDEKELGSVLIDIGGSSSDVGVFLRGSLCHSESIPMGGNHFTKDISVGLRTPLVEAEKLKKERGCADASLVELEELLEVDSIGGDNVRLVSREMLCQVIQARAEELFSLVRKQLESWQCRRDLVAGAVIAGGMSMLEAMDVVAERVMGMPVRVGSPTELAQFDEAWISPPYAAAAGLLLYAQGVLKGSERKVVRPAVPPGLVEKASSKMRHWLLEMM